MVDDVVKTADVRQLVLDEDALTAQRFTPDKPVKVRIGRRIHLSTDASPAWKFDMTCVGISDPEWLDELVAPHAVQVWQPANTTDSFEILCPPSSQPVKASDLLSELR